MAWPQISAKRLFCGGRGEWGKCETSMDAQTIEALINQLKVDKLGRIRGKQKLMNAIQVEHFKTVDSSLMDIRVFVAKLSLRIPQKEAMDTIDKFIYEKQVGKNTRFVRVRFSPKDTDSTYDGTVIEETQYSYLVIPDGNLSGTATWNKKCCEVLGK